MWEIAIICFVLYLVFKHNDRRREFDDIDRRRAELEVQQRVLLDALDRLRKMR